jgi:hypothetical protein
VQIDTWTGDGLAFRDKIFPGGNRTTPFDVIDSTGTNLRMFNNVYFLAEEPLQFYWNERVYATIDEWRAETGLDGNSQFVIGPLPSQAQSIRSALDALMREPTLRPELFHKLHGLAKGKAQAARSRQGEGIDNEMRKSDTA